VRQIVLDTETTGLEVEQGHRIIEIGAVEIVNRRLTGRHYHQYLNPERPIDEGAQEVHGISLEFLADKPLFADVAEAFLDFVAGADLVIHNAPFDMAFLNSELSLLDRTQVPCIETHFGDQRRRRLERLCGVTDSLVMARDKHPGQRNSLDALCRRYEVDNSSRTLHGALLDAEILADVYLLMTGGQTALFGAAEEDAAETAEQQGWEAPASLAVIAPSAAEQAAHETYLARLDERAGTSVWRDPA
jgi:DNA polymerase-3 subunit epsilon